jgi:uncharacterized membrane protein (TIGR01218 family)
VGKLMIGKINRVKSNLRYRILTSNDTYYLIDVGNSPWKILIPHFYWISSNPGYMLDRETAFKLTMDNTHQTKAGKYAVLGGLFSISSTNFLTPLIEKLNIDSSVLVNALVAILLISIIIFVTLMIQRKQKQSIRDTINYTELPMLKIKITQPKISEIFKFTLVYITAMVAALIPIIAFIHFSNLFMLSCGLIFLVIFIILSGLALNDGKYNIKIK